MATPVATPLPNDSLSEAERAERLARRYHAEFVDLKHFKIQHELFKSVPVDMMFRYNFVPLEQSTDGRLAIAVGDPDALDLTGRVKSMAIRISAPTSATQRRPMTARRRNRRTR